MCEWNDAKSARPSVGRAEIFVFSGYRFSPVSNPGPSAGYRGSFNHYATLPPDETRSNFALKTCF